MRLTAPAPIPPGACRPIDLDAFRNLVFGAATKHGSEASHEEIVAEFERLRDSGMRRNDAVKAVAEKFGLRKNDVYKLLLG